MSQASSTRSPEKINIRLARLDKLAGAASGDGAVRGPGTFRRILDSDLGS